MPASASRAGRRRPPGGPPAAAVLIARGEEQRREQCLPAAEVEEARAVGKQPAPQQLAEHRVDTELAAGEVQANRPAGAYRRAAASIRRSTDGSVTAGGASVTGSRPRPAARSSRPRQRRQRRGRGARLQAPRPRRGAAARRPRRARRRAGAARARDRVHGVVAAARPRHVREPEPRQHRLDERAPHAERGAEKRGRRARRARRASPCAAAMSRASRPGPYQPNAVECAVLWFSTACPRRTISRKISRKRAGTVADAEEARLGARAVEEIEHARRDVRVGPVVEGDRDLGAAHRRRREPHQVRPEQAAPRREARAEEERMIGGERSRGPPATSSGDRGQRRNAARVDRGARFDRRGRSPPARGRRAEGVVKRRGLDRHGGANRLLQRRGRRSTRSW